MGNWFSSLLDVFYAKNLDIVLIGLSGSGKSTFAKSIALDPSQRTNIGDTLPTIGSDIQVFQKNGIQLKVWDLGGQAAYRADWQRYVPGSDAIVLVIDTQHPFDLVIIKKELHRLLESPHLAQVPILILANKIDLGSKIKDEQEIIEGLNLDYVTENPWLIIQCSALQGDNIDKALEFLLQYAH